MVPSSSIEKKVNFDLKWVFSILGICDPLSLVAPYFIKFSCLLLSFKSERDINGLLVDLKVLGLDQLMLWPVKLDFSSQVLNRYSWWRSIEPGGLILLPRWERRSGTPLSVGTYLTVVTNVLNEIVRKISFWYFYLTILSPRI